MFGPERGDTGRSCRPAGLTYLGHQSEAGGRIAIWPQRPTSRKLSSVDLAQPNSSSPDPVLVPLHFWAKTANNKERQSPQNPIRPPQRPR